MDDTFASVCLAHSLGIARPRRSGPWQRCSWDQSLTAGRAEGHGGGPQLRPDPVQPLSRSGISTPWDASSSSDVGTEAVLAQEPGDVHLQTRRRPVQGRREMKQA